MHVAEALQRTLAHSIRQLVVSGKYLAAPLGRPDRAQVYGAMHVATMSKVVTGMLMPSKDTESTNAKQILASRGRYKSTTRDTENEWVSLRVDIRH